MIVKNKINDFLLDSKFFYAVLGFVIGAIVPTWFLIDKNPDVLGDLGEWVGAIATTFAVVVALKDSRDSRKPIIKLEAVAYLDMKMVTINVYNDGKVPIFETRLFILRYSNDLDKEDNIIETEIYNERIDPGNSHMFSFAYPVEYWNNEKLNPYHLGPELLQESWDKIKNSKDIEVLVEAGRERFVEKIFKTNAWSK